VVKNASILMGGKTLQAILSLGYIALAARSMGPEYFGMFVLIHAFAQAVGEIAKFQSWQAVLQFGTGPLVEGRLGDFQRVLRFSLLLDAISAVLGAGIGIAAALTIGTYLGWTDEMAPLAAIYATSIIFMVGATPTGILRLLDRFDLMALQSGVAAIVRSVGALLAAWLAFFAMPELKGAGSLPMFLAVWYFSNVAAFLFLFGAAGWQLHRQGHLAGLRWRRQGSLTAGLPGIWRFVWSTNLNATIDLAFTHVGTLAIGAMLGARDAGLYRIARQVSDGVSKPARLLVPALYPELARLWFAGDGAGMRRLALRLGLLAGATATALLLLVALIGRPALALILGADFADAADVMLLLLAGTTIGVWAMPLEPILVATGRPGAALRVRIWVAILYLPALFFAVHELGLVGAGLASIAASILLFAGMLRAVLQQRPSPQQAAGGISEGPPVAVP
jgi:O-antigen/teichoic acid export membrane protein